MVATRAQRAQTKDEPAPPKKSALKAPARRGTKKAAAEKPAPEPKPIRTAATKKATKPTAPAQKAAVTTRKTRAKEAEAPAPEEVDEPTPVEQSEREEESAPPAPAKIPKKTTSKTATKTATTTRKRPAKESEPGPAPPAKRRGRPPAHSKAESAPAGEDQVMDEPAEVAPTATRATRATRGTKSSDTRAAAAVKPLAQRITVKAKKSTKKAKEEAAPESAPEEPSAPEVEMEEAEETLAPEPPKSTRKNLRKTMKEPVEQAKPEDSSAPEAEMQNSEKSAAVTPIKSAKTQKKAAQKDVQETIQEEPELEKPEEPTTATPAKSAKKNRKGTEMAPQAASDRAIHTDETEEPTSADAPKTPQTAPDAPVRITIRTPATSTFQKSGPESTPQNSYVKQTTPTKQTPMVPQDSESAPPKENAPPATPGPAQVAEALPFAQAATPFFKPGPTPKTVSFEATAPSFKKSLLQETPRKAPISSPLKMPPMSAAKQDRSDGAAGDLFNSPAKKVPMAASILGITPMRASTAKPDFKTSALQTPAKKGLMLPPSTAPVNRNGFHNFQVKSSLLQTCPRRIALPGLLPTSSMASPTKGSGEGPMGSSLLSGTPRKVHIESPAKAAFGTSVHDFAFQAQSSVLGATPRRPKTPARTPARRFATPGKTPFKSLVDADAGSPTPVKATPAGLKDVTSALDFLDEGSPGTPTEWFVRGVIEKLDQDMPQEPQVPSDKQRVSPAEDVVDDLPTSGPEELQAEVNEVSAFKELTPEELDEFIVNEDSVMEEQQSAAEAPVPESVVEHGIMTDEQNSAEILAAEGEQSHKQVPAQEPAKAVWEMSVITEESSVLEQQEDSSMIDQQVTVEPELLERPSTPKAEEQKTAALAKEKAKTERRARSKRLSLAIELENSVRKPRQSLAFIPSLSPTKSSLRPSFKKPFGSPKKTVAWAPVPAEPEVSEFEINIPRPDDKLLSGTVFFVDVRTAEGEDAGDLFIPLLEEMGAKVIYSWNGSDSGVTHVLFKDGNVQTLEKVEASQSAVKAINIGWALDCERFNKWVPEDSYLIDVSRPSSQSPTRALTTLSANMTPTRPTPAKPVSYGTPFALLNLTPKAKASLSPFADISTATTPNANPFANISTTITPTTANKENMNAQTPPSKVKASPALTMGAESPNTPYYLHAQNLVQKTCPPKQINRGLFDKPVESEVGVTPFRQKLLLARRSLSPVKISRVLDM